jgi:prophage regulatory protein
MFMASDGKKRRNAMSRTNDDAPWRDRDPEGRLLRPEEVVTRTGLSKSQIYAMIAEGKFPPFVKLSARASALPEAWLRAFIDAKAADAIGNKRPSDRNGEIVQ